MGKSPLDKLWGTWLSLSRQLVSACKEKAGPSMTDFIPPQPNPLVLTAVRAIMPLVLKGEHLDVRPSEHCLALIRSQKNIPCVIAVNHIDRCDPAVTATLSTKCKEDYYFLAARELFDENFGIRGWLMKNAGVYSVIRGQPEDIESRDKTISLIAEGKQKLVMFPEGDVTGRDDLIMPLKRDGIRNMFEAQKLCLEMDSKREVHIIPTAIYYEVADNALQPLKNCLAELELYLGLITWNGSLEARIQRVLDSMIRQLEEHYGATASHKTTNGRITNLCRYIVTAIANLTGSQDLEQPSMHAFLYSVRGKLQRLKSSLVDNSGRFDDMLRAEEMERLEVCFKDLDRVQNLLILASTLHQKPASLDVLWRIIDRMENIILGKVTSKGDRIAWIDSAPPISLLRRHRDYVTQPANAIERAERRLRSSMQQVLETLKQKSEVQHKRDRSAA